VAGGDLTIANSIRLDGAAYVRSSVPSLGVIASGNILIPAAVTQVDAYLFSNGTIDTCQEATVLACSTVPLLVNGFLMGRTISFHRSGLTGTTGSQVAERVTLNPQIYLNPPTLFDASVDGVILENQGERQPLY
jgi:hypothetical protein